MPTLRNGNNGVRTRALSIASPAFYQLSYRAPTVRDDMPGDFMAFVRKALHAVNAKLDNIVSLQCSMEKKLADIDTRVTRQGSVIAGRTESVEFNAANITTQQTAIDIVKKSEVSIPVLQHV